MSIFGTLTTPYDAERAVAALIEKWMPTYLAEFERQTGEPVRTFERPEVRVTRNDGDNWPEDQLPVVLVSGDPGEPEMGNAGVGYWYTFRALTVAVGIDEDDALHIAQTITAAVQALVLQHRSIEGLAEDTVPVGMDFPPDGDAARSRARGEFNFRSFIPQIVDPQAGPAVPDPKPDPDEPHGDWPTVSGVDISVVPRPVDG